MATMKTAPELSNTDTCKGTVAIYLPQLRIGGAEISTVNLANGLRGSGFKVWIVVHVTDHSLDDRLRDIEVVDLQVPNSLQALPALMRFLNVKKPDVLISALTHNNLIAALARTFAASPSLLIMTEHAPVTQQIELMGGVRYRVLPVLIPLLYPLADAIVAVSRGVQQDLKQIMWRRAELLSVIYNPVLPQHWQALSSAPIADPWFQLNAPPVVLSVGRLRTEKNFPMLIDAFARLRTTHPAMRLAILGDGPEKPALQAQIDTLGLQAHARLLGAVPNPLAYMRRSTLFVLASVHEGFGNVLVEAMACGLKVISTDCPVGPREVLDGGRFGTLVPVGDADALLAAMRAALDDKADPADTAQSVSHAMQFTVERCVQDFIALFATIRARKSNQPG